MARKGIPTQLSNLKTLQMYRRQMFNITENRIQYPNLSAYVDMKYVNRCLFRQGVVASFIDDVLGHLILPFQNVGVLDCYGRPTTIICYGLNGYRSKILKRDEFVLLYDTTGEYPLIYDVEQYAERMSLDVRTMDINIGQQKTPRIFTTSSGNEMTVKNIINNIDSCENEVLAYSNQEIDDLNAVLAPAPFVADKVNEHKREVWSEFLRLIGVTDITIQKKERLIKDEVNYSQGGTIIGRYASAYPRDIWKQQCKEKLGIDVDWHFYDNLNTDLSLIDSNGGDDYDISDTLSR